ncbi:MAG: OPT/YSL family transporter [Phycisphaerae bacterium]
MTAIPKDIPIDAATGTLENGLTSRTWPVILYGAFILMPANIYLMLVAGQSLVGPISFIALILWVEAARLSRKPLTTAEAFIVYSVSAVAAGQLLFYAYAIFPSYFRVSEVANSDLFSFTDPATGRRETFGQAAPAWWAPPVDVVRQRSFMNAAWLLPIGVGICSWFFHMLADLTMGVLGYYLFVKVEKLPFPFAHPPAEACKALTSGSPDAKKVFTITGLIGAVWGLLIYLPMTLGKGISDYPIPWADFNRRIHTFLKGASMGIATDILAFCGGFIIPFRVIVSMVIGAVAVQFIGNAWAAGGLGEMLHLDPVKHPTLCGVAHPEMITTSVSPSGKTVVQVPQSAQYFQRFVRGMGVTETLANQIFVWMPAVIAAMLCAGLLPLLTSPRELARTFGALGKSSRGAIGERMLPLRALLATFLFSVAGATALFTILIRVFSGWEFPWWIVAPFALIWSLMFSLIDIRAIGTTGFRIDPPYVREGMIFAMKPRKIDIWFAPWPIALGASGWVSDFKTAELTGCKPRSLILAKLIAYPVGMLASLLFMSIFWSIAPIPSSQYPYTTATLPVWANQFCIWISASLSFSGIADVNPTTQSIISQLFNVKWMLITAGVFVAVFILGKLWKRGAISLIGLAVGMVMPIPFAMSLLVGGLVAMWIKRKTGQEWFGRNRNIIVAGLAVGEGVVVGLMAAIAAMVSSLVALPY